MTEDEFQEYFETTFPKMYTGRHGGICTGQGWFNILRALSQNIQSHIDWKNRTETVVPQVVVVQVKEKFGTLRFYYDGGDDVIDGMVRMAESMSGVMCEQCGDPATTHGGGWIRTLCEKHEAEYQQQRAEYDNETV